MSAMTIRHGHGNDDRGTRWGPLTGRRQVMLNNLVVGCDEAMRQRPADIAAGNLTDRGRGATAATIAFADPARLDYRPTGAWPAAAATPAEFAGLVTHDFNGLPRLPDDPQVPGALRREPTFGADVAGVVEWELADGTLGRNAR